MAATASTRFSDLSRAISVRQVRLVCGVILFAYVVSHFLNHALGNISVDAMEIGVYYHMLFWQFLPVAIVFYTAALTHMGLGIYALYQRRQFRWRTVEPLQLVLGLSIPALVMAHVIGVRLGQTLYGHQKLYPQELYLFFVASNRIWTMTILLLIAWVHGCIGIYFWLRLKPFFTRAAPYLLAAAVLIPTLSLLGVYQGGRSVEVEADDGEWRTHNLTRRQLGTTAEAAMLDRITGGLTAGYLGLLALALLARGARALRERRGGMIALSYGNGKTVRVPKGLSVLEASLRHNVPHASVCGGRARCSTCRIRIIGDHGALPEPSQREAFVLTRVGTSDPSIRLACQLRPTSDLSFFQLFTAHTLSANTQASTPARIGQERYLVSLFVDMRGSTQLAEKRLPFDTVFIVNRFLGAVSQAVIENGGQPNQFVGDGMLALFGLSADPQTACRQALKAAAGIARHIDELNELLSHDLRQPIRFGIGIHGGEVIIGDIGYRDHIVFTALGDAVNVAARLQDMTKTLACEAIASEEVRRTAGLADDALPQQEVAIRGRDEPMAVRVVADARELSALVDRGERVAA
ncbi:adenylate/guanylate cyclase domain-containing protein [Bradyrhizobium canariense]|uniref:adenylate/guanylate cyclase domain-containing protein n=1 Tax=Bradyrhizobium canariense TaxID=255045 RepID=UPI000A19965E|nr:adenylate/guanylate cyclase domain-containing protein [Bradyrhizobium canariense]OSI27964.1 adenylate/guanylate cyclase domain-containing protein [Bradyrhizobium canariense]OSI32083.1 adenylate/guanylate cyclase domain-containing protein [Bradyrhizobium canariense]OSI41871.1 adenylate/guanylate cyclase domain-containing protein [Bradyrhizobium canariense]OSI47340.1 adenylate/guanylate cyclase domain-containing protein [Bradyrhizobium canariense]OSI57834.1 adenylate/guanylate cyclase domain-